MAQLVCCGVMQHVFIDPLKRSSPRSLKRMFARLGCDHHEADDIDVNMDDPPPLQIVPNLSSMLQSSEHLAEQIDRAAGTLRSLQHCFSAFGDRLAAEGAIRTLDDITLNFSAHGQLAKPYQHRFNSRHVVRTILLADMIKDDRDMCDIMNLALQITMPEQLWQHVSLIIGSLSLRCMSPSMMSRYLGGLGGVACLGAWGPVRPTQVANVDAKSDIF
jgi:hypothetical protein